MGLLLVTGETLLAGVNTYGIVVTPRGTTTVPPVWAGNVVDDPVTRPDGTVVSVGSPEPLITDTE
jgi:hypothetical protein